MVGSLRGVEWAQFQTLQKGVVILMVLGISRESALGKVGQAKALFNSAPPVAYATLVDRPPRMDGKLDDPLWRSAQPITNFKQIEPNEGQPPTEKTEVRVLYTREAVYFGIMCYDSNSKGIVATELRRDLPQNLDDYFEILIDSSHDHRNAYVFQFNLLGTQSNGLITDEQGGGGSQDYVLGWDGIWIDQTKITRQGWSATVEIPFMNLNFMQTQNVIWGMNFKRFIRRKNEEDLWTAYRREYGFTKVSEAGELKGITNIGSGRLLIVKPYAVAGVDHLNPGGTQNLTTGGLDIKYGLRSNLVANLTGNTDFGQAEVDQQQFNLTPYKLFYPETRDFFLENASTFNFATGLNDLLFYSRQIGIDPVTGEVVPIDGGAKITGTLGPYEVGFLDVKTRAEGPNPFANYGVVRVKRTLFGDSYVGFMGTDKKSGSATDPYNRAEGVDTRLVFLKNLIFSGYAAKTESPGLRGGDSNVGGQVSYTTDWLQFQAMQDNIGPNFNPEVGFVNQANLNQRNVDLNLAPRPNIPGVRELNFEGFIYYAPNTTNVLQTQEWQGTLRILWNNGAYTDDDLWDVFTQRIVQPFNIYKNIFIPPGIYHFARHQITFGSPQDRRLTYSLFERFGTYYTGHLNEARIRTTYRPTPHFSTATSVLWDKFNLKQGNFSVVLANLQANYAFTRFFTTSTLVQVDTADPQAVSVNFRMRYNYRPNSDIFLIYNLGTAFASLAAGNPIPLRENRIELKITRSFFTPSWKGLRGDSRRGSGEVPEDNWGGGALSDSGGNTPGLMPHQLIGGFGR